ncbi:hypothetical protein [Intrasporangium sp. YIM S08009]|uniref:hypothetical protein n=1 Tax=Intrasporangium zincisolvens TaxID=3080018 RepID=UPI002B05C85F|nr:hypothetical protein [Intrasporangium sp. YIM S08009]
MRSLTTSAPGSQTSTSKPDRGIADIEEALKEAKAGIVVVTKHTMERPWINFEAGALSKVVGDDPKNRVIPLLVGFDKTTDLLGPLSILQAVPFDEDGMRRVLRSLYSAFGMPDKSASRIKAYWPELKKAVDDILETHPISPAGQTIILEEGVIQKVADLGRSTESVLDEVLAIVRGIRDKEAGPERQGVYWGGAGYWGDATSQAGSPADGVSDIVRRAQDWAHVNNFHVIFEGYEIETMVDLEGYFMDVVIWVNAEVDTGTIDRYNKRFREYMQNPTASIIPFSQAKDRQI